MNNDSFREKKRIEFLNRISNAIRDLKLLLNLVSNDVDEEINNQKEQKSNHDHHVSMN